MTRFNRVNTKMNGDVLEFEGKFIARFKYRHNQNVQKFKQFLINNFTPTEYFNLYQEGLTPMDILRTKGF